MTDVEVAIVGGGISGLSAAYALQRHGVSFVLFERESRLGGVIRTDHIDGFTIDGGPDSLLVQKPAALDLCRELGLGDRLVPTLEPRTAYVVRDGRLHPMLEASVLGIPTRVWPLVTTSLLSPGGKLRMLLDLVQPSGPAVRDESVAAFFSRRFGRETVDYIAEPLLAGIHAGDVDRLSMRALFPRLVEAEQRHGSVIRAFRALEASRPPDGMFRSLPDGIAEMTTAIERTLPTHAVRRGAGAEGITGRGPFRIVGAGGSMVTARQLIMAVPAYVASELLSPLDTRLGALCGEIRYESSAAVVLAYPKSAVSHPVRGTGFVVPRVERSVSVTAGSWISSKWPHRAPDDQLLVRGFVGGARQPDALDADDDTLIDRVDADFRRLLGITTTPHLRRVYRWPRRNAQHEVGHLDRLMAIDRRLDALPTLHLIGAGFRGVGIPDCVEHGRTAADAAVALAQTAAARQSRQVS